MAEISPSTLSRALSHALRHEPWLYELELDEHGWARLDQLLLALRDRGGPWAAVDRAQVEATIANSTKERHEIRGGHIRALYGHSTAGKLARARATPPPLLLHGTSPAASQRISQDGLLPMHRQYVHLSVDQATALAVARRKSARPVILSVRAAEAHASGIRFYRGNACVWLADAIPPEYIAVSETDTK